MSAARPAPGIPQAALFWEARYLTDGRLWGDGPSALARLAVARLRPAVAAVRKPDASPLDLIDVGCGYGRDSRYLAAELGCRVLGLDPSPAAVAAARKARSVGLDVEYVAGDLASLGSDAAHAGPYDVVFICNVYHLLGPIGRREFAAAAAAAVRPGGLLFLSTLSPRDAQHYAVGEPVSGEERSWVEQVYLHFCSADELARDFAAFEVLDLEERSYDEHNANGQVHHHTSWFLEGRKG
jgi:2-polyprenyl-3-methyl-5-hydroxy-6-metoxy-1,4-benzoquinol methylase